MLGSSAIITNHSLKETSEKVEKLSQEQRPMKPVAFRPHLSMGLALSKIANLLVRLLQAEALGRQRWGILR